MRVPEQDIVALFKDKFPDGIPPCGLCGNEQWLFDDVLYELRESQTQHLFSRADAKVFPLDPGKRLAVVTAEASLVRAVQARAPNATALVVPA